MNVWPIDLFQATTFDASLQGRIVTGGMSVSGISQVVRTDGGGLWRLSFSGIFLRSADMVRAWRAWEGILDGGAQNVIVPICDLRHGPRPIVGGVPLAPGATVPHSDDAYFSDTTGYVSPLIEAETVGTAVLGATTIVIDVTVGELLRGGEHFTLDHPTREERIYRVVKVTSAVGTVQTVQIRPPLREATTDGMVVDFDRPRCVMRLATPDSMALPLQLGRFGTGLSVSFVESF